MLDGATKTTFQAPMLKSNVAGARAFASFPLTGNREAVPLFDCSSCTLYQFILIDYTDCAGKASRSYVPSNRLSHAADHVSEEMRGLTCNYVALLPSELFSVREQRANLVKIVRLDAEYRFERL